MVKIDIAFCIGIRGGEDVGGFQVARYIGAYQAGKRNFLYGARHLAAPALCGDVHPGEVAGFAGSHKDLPHTPVKSGAAGVAGDAGTDYTGAVGNERRRLPGSDEFWGYRTSGQVVQIAL